MRVLLLCLFSVRCLTLKVDQVPELQSTLSDLLKKRLTDDITSGVEGEDTYNTRDLDVHPFEFLPEMATQALGDAMEKRHRFESVIENAQARFQEKLDAKKRSKQDNKEEDDAEAADALKGKLPGMIAHNLLDGDIRKAYNEARMAELDLPLPMELASHVKPEEKDEQSGEFSDLNPFRQMGNKTLENSVVENQANGPGKDNREKEMLHERSVHPELRDAGAGVVAADASTAGRSRNFKDLDMNTFAARVAENTDIMSAPASEQFEGNKPVRQPAYMWINPNNGLCYMDHLRSYEKMRDCVVASPTHDSLGPKALRGRPMLSLPGTADCKKLGYESRCKSCDSIHGSANVYYNKVGQTNLENEAWKVQNTANLMTFFAANKQCDNGGLSKLTQRLQDVAENSKSLDDSRSAQNLNNNPMLFGLPGWEHQKLHETDGKGDRNQLQDMMDMPANALLAARPATMPTQPNNVIMQHILR